MPNTDNALRISALALLLFNGIGAIYGGISFITDPSGTGLGMNTSYLSHSPFTNYLTPGIVLLAVNGIFALVVAGAVIKRHPYMSRLVLAQGILLLGWLAVQLMMLRIIYYLHVVMAVVGTALCLVGYLLSKTRAGKATHKKRPAV